MIGCIGNGVRRFHLKSEAFQTVRGRGGQKSSQSRVELDIERSHTNSQTRSVYKLVWALNVSPAIDSSVKLLVASIGAARGTSCKNEALSLHIDAISTWRKSLMGSDNAIDNMTATTIIDTCNVGSLVPNLCETDK